MICRCGECGGTNIYDLGIQISAEIVTATPVNNNEELNKATLPYYLGEYYCADCQTFCTILEEPEPGDLEPISEKQKKYLLSMIKTLQLNKIWTPEKIAALNKREASQVIKSLKEKPKPAVKPATKKQKDYIKSLIEGKEEYSQINFDKLSAITASKLIFKLTR